MVQTVKNPPEMRETWIQFLSFLGRSLGEGNSYTLQYSGLENSHGVMKSGTGLSDFHFHFAVLIFSSKSSLYILDESLMSHALQIFSLVYGLPFYFCNNMF